ncbi:hypothetical protein CSE45_0855 [Citreicella sp. SE45]|nr:hypothetical protein CSE45_0855 [Citreicella sp. SE45]
MLRFHKKLLRISRLQRIARRECGAARQGGVDPLKGHGRPRPRRGGCTRARVSRP